MSVRRDASVFLAASAFALVLAGFAASGAATVGTSPEANFRTEKMGLPCSESQPCPCGSICGSGSCKPGCNASSCCAGMSCVQSGPNGTCAP